MLKIYTILLYIALPAIFFRLLWRSRKQPAYRHRLLERFGWGGKPDAKRCLWIHAVSVGEVMAAQSIVAGLKAIYPDKRLLITTMTPTGAATVARLFGDTVTHRYLPYDLPFAIDRFFDQEKPDVGMIMETELWPNLIYAAKCKKIPLFLLNARLSTRSQRGYARFPAITRHMLQGLSGIAVQSAEEKARFLALGAAESRVQVTGSVKFDLSIPQDVPEKAAALRKQWGHRAFIWIAASTHAGEEKRVFMAHQALLAICPDALLIIVPRHPDRFQTVYDESQRYFCTGQRSRHAPVTPETTVYLADTMGELPLFYAISDVAFVGGSLVNTGGHNLLEPAALAKPILTGPHVFNFVAISQALQKAGGMLIVTAESLTPTLLDLYQHPDRRDTLGNAAKNLLAANRGATEKQLALIVC